MPAGKWGTVAGKSGVVKCDLPYWTLINMLDHINATHKDVGFNKQDNGKGISNTNITFRSTTFSLPAILRVMLRLTTQSKAILL